MNIKTTGVLGSINTPVDYETLVKIDKNYTPNLSRAYFLIDGNIKVGIYKTGKIQIYGIKGVDEDTIKYYWNKTLSYLSQYVDVSKSDKLPKVKFILALDDLKVNLNLLGIYKYYKSFEIVEFEPEQFSGLIWKLSGATCLLFSNGKCVVTGANSVDIIENTITELKMKIDKYNSSL